MIWKLDPEVRLHRWKLFRESLNNLTFENALEQTVELWKSSPFSPYYLDHSNPTNWPNPWTLIAENYYCDLAKALGILYTIKFTNHNPDCEIKIYHSKTNGQLYNLVWIDKGKYVLNMVDNEILNKTHVDQAGLVLKFEYNKIDLKLDSF